jgi:hypothetical protein
MNAILKRNAYLLTTDFNSPRALFSKKILQQIGFDVISFLAIPNNDPIMSHKLSMIQIYNIIENSPNEWSYIFEDDINILEQITLDEIIEYEKISTDNFFYLGICKWIDMSSISTTPHTINNHKVYQVSGAVRGTHAIAFSKNGIKQFNQFIKHFSIVAYDMLIELYTLSNPANVIRCDLSSTISGHLGLFFQDREKFKSSLHEHYYDV